MSCHSRSYIGLAYHRIASNALHMLASGKETSFQELEIITVAQLCGWEGKGRYGSFRLRMNVWVCR